MTTAIVAVLGTLAGALLTGTLTHLSQRAQRVAAEDIAAHPAEALRGRFASDIQPRSRRDDDHA
ncbi:hypothetical protein ABT115_15565 [Streptomyces sp. NPDC001832]|uniref:hypothetical protein n=1 Tax=Streptomyces sp. NPDC001832 TaxID=3154527 RepID=UPI0033285105